MFKTNYKIEILFWTNKQTNISDFIATCKSYGRVNYEYESDDPADRSNKSRVQHVVTIFIPILKADQQQMLTFNIPNVQHLTNVSTAKQIQNGTVILLDEITGDKYALYSSGYVRRTPYRKKPGSDDQVLMLPGGGTPDEMVKCMIKSIEKTRAKSIKSYNESRVLDEIKGTPLYQTQSIPSDVIVLKEKIEDYIRNKLHISEQDAFINLTKSTKNYVLSVRFINDHAMTPADVKDFASKYKQYGEVQIKQEAKSVYDPLYDDESNYPYDFYVKILIPIAKEDLQTVLKFVVPNILHTTDITTKQQKENGTVAIEDDLTGDKYFLYSSGYVRRRRSDARPGAIDSNLMLPGGGTPDEMVRCMIRAIERARAKQITHYESVTRQDVKLALQEIKRRHAAAK